MIPKFRQFFIVAVAAIMLFSSIPSTVFAGTTYSSSLPELGSAWSRYGAPTFSKEAVTLYGSSSQWAHVDVLASSVKESYIIFAAYAKKDDSRTRYSSSDRARSGNPYFYAYQMDKSGKILKYLSGTNTVSTTRSGYDYVVYGIFPKVQAETIRVFLKQSGVKGISNSGVNVTFEKPVLLSASSESIATSIVNDYAKQQLSFVYANSTTNSSSTTTQNNKTVFSIGFEPNVTKDYLLGFGSSLSSWVYGSHDYPSSISPYNKTTQESRYSGVASLRLENASYGYINGSVSTQPVYFDEALRYKTTGKLKQNTTYTLSAKVKYWRGNSGTSYANLSLAQESGSEGQGVIEKKKDFTVGTSWTTIEYTFKNTLSTSTTQDLVLFFGELRKGGRLYVDDFQLIEN